ncbi:acyl-CoA thioesterase [Pseudonocardia hispaniensis]|uniref:Acyl-CoA thioesterase n=1 Tax=Pseudonocardia hispaniensis TaxID=904933 RepID=A0ABW1J7M4_9PSEU
MPRVALARTDPSRFRISQYPVLFDRQPRYHDLDPSRRIGRGALIRWFEDARVAVEHQAGVDFGARSAGVRRLLASVRLDVRAPLRWMRSYRVGIGVSRIGTSSFDYSYGVFTDDGCVAVGESVSVHVTDAGPSPLPPAVRQRLQELTVPAIRVGRVEQDPARLVREAYPFRLDVRTRFTDLDTNRHANNVALAGWYLDALAELHLDVLGYPLGGPLDGLSPSSLSVQYLAEVVYPAVYELRVGVIDVDETSVRYGCGLFLGPRCVGLADAVGAHAAAADGNRIELASALQKYRMRR